MVCLVVLGFVVGPVIIPLGGSHAHPFPWQLQVAVTFKSTCTTQSPTLSSWKESFSQDHYWSVMGNSRIALEQKTSELRMAQLNLFKARVSVEQVNTRLERAPGCAADDY